MQIASSCVTWVMWCVCMWLLLPGELMRCGVVYIWKESCDEMSSSVVVCVMWVVAGKV